MLLEMNSGKHFQKYMHGVQEGTAVHLNIRKWFLLFFIITSSSHFKFTWELFDLGNLES